MRKEATRKTRSAATEMPTTTASAATQPKATATRAKRVNASHSPITWRSSATFKIWGRRRLRWPGDGAGSAGVAVQIRLGFLESHMEGYIKKTTGWRVERIRRIKGERVGGLLKLKWRLYPLVFNRSNVSNGVGYRNWVDVKMSGTVLIFVKHETPKLLDWKSSDTV